MPRHAYSERLRYAFSYLEKARALAQTGPPSHNERAQTLLSALRLEIHQEMNRVAADLRDTIEKQHQLSKRLMAGKVAPTKANELNRRLTQRLSELRVNHAAFHALLAAQSASDLGGFVNLPPEEYPQTIASETCTSDTQPTDRRRQFPHLPLSRSPFLHIPRLISNEPTVAGIQLKPTPLGLVVWVACLAIALTITLTYLGVIHWRPTISLDIGKLDPASGMVQVTCLNHGLRMARLHVPWLEGRLPRTDNSEVSGDYGIAVDIREQGNKQYRQVPQVLQCWRYKGRPLSEDLVIEIAPGVPITLTLDTRQLGSGASLESLRIALLRPDGRSVVQREESFIEALPGS